MKFKIIHKNNKTFLKKGFKEYIINNHTKKYIWKKKLSNKEIKVYTEDTRPSILAIYMKYFLIADYVGENIVNTCEYRDASYSSFSICSESLTKLFGKIPQRIYIEVL